MRIWASHWSKTVFVAAAGQDFVHGFLDGFGILQVVVEIFAAMTVRAGRYVDDDAAFFAGRFSSGHAFDGLVNVLVRDSRVGGDDDISRGRV